MISVGLVLLLIHSASSFLYDGPCYLSPRYPSGIPDSDFSMTVTVQSSCRNGTFDWNYPRGHIVLNFQNPHHVPESICFRNSLGGEVFKIYDQTSANEYFLGNITDTNQVCTQTQQEEQIVLRVDAPEEIRYMGAVGYTVTQ